MTHPLLRNAETGAFQLEVNFITDPILYRPSHWNLNNQDQSRTSSDAPCLRTLNNPFELIGELYFLSVTHARSKLRVNLSDFKSLFVIEIPVKKSIVLRAIAHAHSERFIKSKGSESFENRQMGKRSFSSQQLASDFTWSVILRLKNLRVGLNSDRSPRPSTRASWLRDEPARRSQANPHSRHCAHKVRFPSTPRRHRCAFPTEICPPQVQESLDRHGAKRLEHDFHAITRILQTL
jgi:hypothetical protein